VRLFFAIALDEAARASATAVAADVQQNLARARHGRAVKWVERENLHVTMRFLGEIDDTASRAVIESARAPLAHAPFELTVGGAGAFPASGAPRVLWIGVHGGADAAAGLFGLLEARLVPLGIEREPRAYTPHVTIGRVREIDRPGGRALREWLAAVPPTLGVQRVDRVTLYHSRLSSAGPRYEVLAEVPLS
jgi:2'-5' RNA ligase